MTWLFRSMQETNGLPVPGPSSRTLGVRPGVDVSACDDADVVYPGTGGMSVSPDNPRHLPRHRRPPQFHGTGKDLVWGLEEDRLPADLLYRPDPDNPGHGFIEPALPMTLAEYQAALARTQREWKRIDRWP
jgi:hypothetical protein